MGIDHSNPYIHSTTVLCDIVARHIIPMPKHTNMYIHTDDDTNIEGKYNSYQQGN